MTKQKALLRQFDHAKGYGFFSRAKVQIEIAWLERQQEQSRRSEPNGD
jgi:hypothetical protein